MEKYDDIKFFKENPKMLASAEETIQKKDAVLGTLEAFLDDNEYKSRPQYKKVKNKLMRCAAMQVHFESRSLIYRRPGNNLGSKQVGVSQYRIDEFKKIPLC